MTPAAATTIAAAAVIPLLLLLLLCPPPARSAFSPPRRRAADAHRHAWAWRREAPPFAFRRGGGGAAPHSAAAVSDDDDDDDDDDDYVRSIFRRFASFLRRKQGEIISELEEMDGSGESFCENCWGVFADVSSDDAVPEIGSGGVTRVLQGGAVVDKGACSLTLIQGGRLSAERAASISGRSGDETAAKEGDSYCAAALSVVLHSRSPMIPTFRSDVRIFLVETDDGNTTTAWFGGGADLTPYYLFDADVAEFHSLYKNLCDAHGDLGDGFDYPSMKRRCDEYFYLPARSEHRGTGGIFFDDLPASGRALDFVVGVADMWMPSWLPIVQRRRDAKYGERHRRWQLLRRGRYLEFNLLYDRGVRFGLAGANPRVEGVMVSAPPLIAWEYDHRVEGGSEEERLVGILKEPRDWAN